MNKDLLLEGCYLLIDGIETVVDKRTLERILDDEIKAEPIRLNVSWLENFGFENDYGHWYLHHSETERVQVVIADRDVIKIEFMFDGDGYTVFDNEIDQVHILQLLYKNRYGKMLRKI